jgi:hypothetical protein
MESDAGAPLLLSDVVDRETFEDVGGGAERSFELVVFDIALLN